MSFGKCYGQEWPLWASLNHLLENRRENGPAKKHAQVQDFCMYVMCYQRLEAGQRTFTDLCAMINTGQITSYVALGPPSGRESRSSNLQPTYPHLQNVINYIARQTNVSHRLQTRLSTTVPTSRIGRFWKRSKLTYLNLFMAKSVTASTMLSQSTPLLRLPSYQI